MERAKVGNLELEYEVSGSGPPVLLIHGSAVAGALRPLLDQDALSGFQLIRYHRRGFAGSSRAPSPSSLTDQASDAVGLLDHLGIERAHVVGHSYGGATALEMAVSYPDRVATLVLLEPALLSVPSAAGLMEAIGPIIEKYSSGDGKGAVDDFLALVGDPEKWRENLDATVPGGAEQAENDAATFFEVELPALPEWSFGADQAGAVKCPVLSVVGTKTAPMFVEGRAQLHEWFPDCKDSDINSSHMLQVEQPEAVAKAIASFLP